MNDNQLMGLRIKVENGGQENSARQSIRGAADSMVEDARTALGNEFMGLRIKVENGELHWAITTRGSRPIGGGCMNDNQFMRLRIRFQGGRQTNNARKSIRGAPNSMRWKRVVGPLATIPIAHYTQFCDGFGAGKNQNRWHRWWIALTSSIWKNRNLLIFQGKSFETSKVMEDALFLLWSWLKSRDRDFCTSFNFWLSNLGDFFG